MGLPSDNVEGYHNGSPIWFAENLRDTQNLLIIHGTGWKLLIALTLCWV